MTFKTWMQEPENKNLLEANNVPLHVAMQIWDAAKVEAVNDYMSLILTGKLIVNLNK